MWDICGTYVGRMWDRCGTYVGHVERLQHPANLSKRQFLIGSPRFEVPMGGEFLLGLRPGTASTQPKEIVVEAWETNRLVNMNLWRLEWRKKRLIVSLTMSTMSTCSVTTISTPFHHLLSAWQLHVMSYPRYSQDTDELQQRLSAALADLSKPLENPWNEAPNFIAKRTKWVKNPNTHFNLYIF